jgi:hypothetical protein
MVNLTVPAAFTARESFGVGTDVGSSASRDCLGRRRFRFDQTPDGPTVLPRSGLARKTQMASAAAEAIMH